MHGYYVFEVTVVKKQSIERLLVMFTSIRKPESEELAEAIESHCNDKSPPDRIVVMGPETIRAALVESTSSGKFAERVRAVTRYHNAPKVEVCCFDWDGTVKDCPDVEMIQRVGMTNIFKSRGAMLETPPTHHYAKPSRSHSRQFLRIGNAMVYGSEIDFIAFCCLRCIPKPVKHLYCDTGAIAPIAYALNTMRTEFNPDIKRATVDSFSSYAGALKFQFRNMAESMVLISATTSEGLSDLLAAKCHVPLTRTVTIYYLGEKQFEGALVCNLKRDIALNPDGFDPFSSYPEHNCPLCKDDESTLIRIEGDQFLTGDTKTEEVSLVATHANHLQPFLERTAGKGLVRANYSHQGTPATNEIFFDLETIFADDALQKFTYYQDQFNWIVDQQVPATLKRIITLDDPASKNLAQLIAKRLRTRLASDVTIVSVSKVKANIDEHVECDGATLVAASAVASGRTLQSLSQMLRHIQPNKLITYIVGLARLPTETELKRIRSNVTQSQDSRKYGFHLIDEVNLPLYGPHDKTSWEKEVDLWAVVIRTCDESARRIIKERLEALRESGTTTKRGMSVGLFWPSLSGTELSLRPNFAFYQFRRPEVVSQSDVFFVIIAILHSLRITTRTAQSLRQHEHVRRVLSPRNFERFNDGIIQAAMLRAAHTAELDYSNSRALSDDMAQILDSIFEHRLGETGEATTEFLLALAMRKLRLDDPALNFLVDKHAAAMDDPISKQLWQFIQAKHND
jgi:hypothetical protein